MFYVNLIWIIFVTPLFQADGSSPPPPIIYHFWRKRSNSLRKISVGGFRIHEKTQSGECHLATPASFVLVSRTVICLLCVIRFHLEKIWNGGSVAIWSIHYPSPKTVVSRSFPFLSLGTQSSRKFLFHFSCTRMGHE